MKKLLSVSFLGILVACGAGQPVDLENGSADDDGPESSEALEVPPAGTLPLSEIIASVEVAAHIAITEVEFEDGVWVVEFVVGGEEYELEIDPITGEALSDEPQKTDDD
jgi:hypothetical protein